MTLPFVLEAVILLAALSPQRGAVPSDPVRNVMGRLQLDQYKSHIKGLAQFGDRMQGTERNRDAIIFWNNEEFGMDGSGTYAQERAPLQGTAREPKWLGLIQHDMTVGAVYDRPNWQLRICGRS